MATVTLYAFEDRYGAEQTWTTFNAREAEEHARNHGFLCIAHEYEWSDSESAWDFRPKNSVANPPERRRTT